MRSRFGFVFRPPSAQEVTLDRSRRGDGFRLVRYVERGDANGEHARFVAKDDVGEVPVADEDELFARGDVVFSSSSFVVLFLFFSFSELLLFKNSASSVPLPLGFFSLCLATRIPNSFSNCAASIPSGSY